MKADREMESQSSPDCEVVEISSDDESLDISAGLSSLSGAVFTPTKRQPSPDSSRFVYYISYVGACGLKHPSHISCLVFDSDGSEREDEDSGIISKARKRYLLQ